MLTSMPRLPLHVLPTFRGVARLANLRAAAEELHLTHSAVSQQIRLLEEQIGFALFDRIGRRVALNSAGATLLRAVEPALAQLDEGLRAAQAASVGAGDENLRVSVLPSFAQRWLLPRMAAWRQRHPQFALELHASQQVVDLAREGFHAALRTGAGPWRGLAAQRLLDSPWVVVGPPSAAQRLIGAAVEALAHEPLLGDGPMWQRWFALAGHKVRIKPVAEFNDAGMMLQAAEQGLGLALAREVLAADALAAGRLTRLSPIALEDPDAYPYWLVYPPALADWPPLAAFRDWLREELERPALNAAAGTATAGRRGSRSPAASAAARKRRAR
jgi:LysR family glycine cleavage system transcriptional activator